MSKQAPRTSSAGPEGAKGPSAPPPRHGRHLIVGIDTGGTFTDIVYRNGRASGTYKLLSTPEDPARAVLDGLAAVLGDRPAARITYGTTIATNAMLERRGARTALVTTEGFEDVIEIGRQARPDLYALEPRKPEPLVGADLRFGLRERVLFDGTPQTVPSARALAALERSLARHGVESVAVCFLHAHTNSAHEQAVAKALVGLDVPITLSHALSPEPGEYERTNTAVANAYVRPVVESHISSLARNSAAGSFRVMQSNGGAIGVRTACEEPVRTMLSGPAGGVASAHARARAAGFDRIVSFDMGGTSTDVALIDGTIPRRAITEVAGVPVRTPCVDIHTVGAGGGSVASVDAGGSLKVGPQSAGADPGPACYGRGELATVTDANLVLGRLRADAFLGGAMALDTDRSRRVLRRLAGELGAGTIEEAAEGVVQVVDGTMERAIRVITVERGQDPRTCALVAFGGAAALHACGLARGLGIETVLVPSDAGLLSAWGVIDGPVIRDRARSVAAVDPTHDRLGSLAAPLARKARAEVVAEGVPAGRVRVATYVRARYLGQSLELEVDLTRGYRRAFDREHARLLHTAAPERSLEVTALRVTATGHDRAQPRRAKAAAPRRTVAPTASSAKVYLDRRVRNVPIHRREDLRAGSVIEGPAVVTEYSSTVLIPSGWSSTVGADSTLQLQKAAAEGTRRG